MATWTRMPQENTGTYRFNGEIYVTSSVAETLSIAELTVITWDIRTASLEHNGLDCLQVFERDTGLCLYCIDLLNDETRPLHPIEHNFATLFFDWEY